VQIRDGPAAVTGDKFRRLPLSFRDGKARKAKEPEVRRPTRVHGMQTSAAEEGDRSIRVAGMSPDRFFSVLGFFFARAGKPHDLGEKDMKPVLTCAALAALLYPGQILAAAPAPADTPYTMDEVVVSATKTEEQRRDIAPAVILLDREDIAASPGNTVGQVLAGETGVDWRTHGDYGGASEEIHLRGMDANATQVLVNGVRMNSPSLGSADVGNIVFDAIDRIEVIKGPGSLLYGSGAMGGTVSMITKEAPRTGMANEVSVGLGTENSHRLAAEHGMNVVNGFGYYLTTSYEESDGFRANSDLERSDVSANLMLDKGQNLKLSFYGDYLTKKYGIPGVVPPAGTKEFRVNGVPYINEESANLLDHGQDDNSHLVLRAKGAPLHWLDYSVTTDYTRMKNLNYNRYAYTDDWYGTGLNAVATDTATTNEIMGIEGLVDLHPLDNASLLLGVKHDQIDWQNEQVSLVTNDLGVDNSQGETSAAVNTLGTFAEAQYRPCAFVKVLAGIRNEKHSTFGTENLPMAGLVVNPLADITIKLNHGKHFLAPTMNDLFWPADLYTKGNPTLAPETGHHTDLTVEQSLADHLVFLTASYFKWSISDKILWGLDENWVYTPQNLDSFTADGLELVVTVGPIKDITASLSYTYTDAEEENSSVTRPATYVSPDQFKAKLVWRSEFGTTAALVANFVGDRPYYGSDKTRVDPVATLDSYWTADLKIEQRLQERWRVTLQAENLFDSQYDTYFGSYFDPGTSASSLGTYPGAGQSFFLKVALDF